MQSKVLYTFNVPESYTALNLKIRLNDVIANWKLNGEISYFMMDNRANVVEAVSNCGISHIPCCSQTLNLVAKGLIDKTIEISSLFHKCRDCVAYLNAAVLLQQSL